jgi:transposase-like protein
MDTSVVATSQRRRRRRHSPEFRTRVIEACRQPGVSIASVALANGLNANLLRKWVVEAERAAGRVQIRTPAPEATDVGVGEAVDATGFVALPLPATTSSETTVPEVISIELRRTQTSIKVEWPVSQAAACASWLRDVFR